MEGLIGSGVVTRTVVAAPQPAAGAGVTVLSPESEYQQLVAVAFRLVTSAAVANRTPIVSVTDGSGVALCTLVCSVPQAAGVTVDYTYAFGAGSWTALTGVAASGGLPPLPLDAGDSVVISINLIDVADQISRVRVTLLQQALRSDA